MTVHAHSGEARLTEAEGASAVVVVRHRGRPTGDWVPSPPGLGLDPREGDPLAEFRQALTQAVISLRTGLQIGRRSFNVRNLVDHSFEESSRHLDTITEAVHYDPVTQTYSEPFTMEAPGSLDDAFFEDTHGDPRGLFLALRNGLTRKLFKRESWPRWHRRKSVTERPRRWLDIQGCQTGAYQDVSVPAVRDANTAEEPFVADPLTQVPYGQRIANELAGEPVRAGTGSGALEEIDGRWVRVLHTDAWGPQEPDRHLPAGAQGRRTGQAGRDGRLARRQG